MASESHADLLAVDRVKNALLTETQIQQNREGLRLAILHRVVDRRAPLHVKQALVGAVLRAQLPAQVGEAQPRRNVQAALPQSVFHVHVSFVAQRALRSQQNFKELDVVRLFLLQRSQRHLESTDERQVEFTQSVQLCLHALQVLRPLS